MADFGLFYLDKEKDIAVHLDMDPSTETLSYTLRTPNHGTGNLITNLARLCQLPLFMGSDGLKEIRGVLPCYIDSRNRAVYVLRLLDTKVANIYPDGTIERKASIPAIAKTLMSQTKDYHLSFRKTVVKTYILRECKFRTDVHTHMNANLDPDLLIALGIHHQLRYPLYYIRKLGLRCTPSQEARLEAARRETAGRFRDSPLKGKYLERKINDNTFLNFADLILASPENTAFNLPRIRASLAILKDGQAVFTNLEKVYLYRYVFCKGQKSSEPVTLTREAVQAIPDPDIVRALEQMDRDRLHPDFARNTLFQDKLLWIARQYARCGVAYAEISDTALARPDAAPRWLSLAHAVLPAIRRETGVTLRFLAAIRRTPLTLVRDRIVMDTMRENLQAIRAIASDPYVAGSDIIGEEINDIRELTPMLTELVRITRDEPSFTVRIHAGENDGLRDNVLHALRIVQGALAPGQSMPHLRIGHGLYTANLASRKGLQLMEDLAATGTVLEFQISSNVRLNNLSSLNHHPLRTYLAHGVACVQGTDGGALYGTDSIDEELALEKLLELSHEDLLAMRRTDQRLLEEGTQALEEKMRRFLLAPGHEDVEAFYARRVSENAAVPDALLSARESLDPTVVLSAQIRELPVDRVPVILAGGSFNQDTHDTRIQGDVCRMLDRLVKAADPSRIFFVIGPSLTGYERYLYTIASGRFDFYAFVPTRLSRSHASRLRGTGIGIRVSIEPAQLAIYKSYAYEIFKRRPSVLLALDGNTSGGNLIQEARNGKQPCAIFVSSHSRFLTAKAASLAGYARCFGDEKVEEEILRAAERAAAIAWQR